MTCPPLVLAVTLIGIDCSMLIFVKLIRQNVLQIFMYGRMGTLIGKFTFTYSDK